jgi:hypothetical protein
MHHARTVSLILVLSLVTLPQLVVPLRADSTPKFVSGFTHAVLDEDFLFTGCGGCQTDEPSHLAEYDKYTTSEPNMVHSLHTVSFHGSGPFANTKADNRAEYFGVSGRPRNFYDGGYQKSFSLDEHYINASGMRQVHELDMHIFKTIGDSTLSFKGDVTNLESQSFNGFVLVYIVENGLVDPDYPGITWNFVLRDYGLNQTLSLSGFSTSTFSGAWPIPADSNATNIQVIATAYDTDTEDLFYGWPYVAQSVCDGCSQATHDIGITGVSAAKTVVGQGFGLSLSAQIANYGTNTENFNVLACANTTKIQTENFTLGSAVSIVVTFRWDTSGFAIGNYTLSVCAEPASGETNTVDNNLTSPNMIMVGMPGDVAPPYGMIDMKDIAVVAKRFGTTPSGPLWDPNADINDDLKIDMRDISLTARHFGERYP